MQSARSRWLVAGAALLTVGLVAAATVALQAQGERPSLGVLPAAASGESRITLATAPLAEKKTGVFILDSQTMRLLIYSVDAGSRMLKLVAVRDVSQDARLSHYNNEHPWPEEIRERVESGVDGEPK